LLLPRTNTLIVVVERATAGDDPDVIVTPVASALLRGAVAPTSIPIDTARFHGPRARA